MALEIVFAVFAAALFGAAVWVCAGLLAGLVGGIAGGILSGIPARILAASSGRHPLLATGASPLESERRAWWRLVRPLFAGGVGLAFLCGWAMQEPDPADEGIPMALFVLACLTGLVTLRALWRASVALKGTRRLRPPIATVGLFRCRQVVSEEYRRKVSSGALRAALAHEAAHARGRDPLRILLAQVAADLQWPMPGAPRRLEAWLAALELRRDDEAVRRGCSPMDLADAVLAAARLSSSKKETAAAAAGGGGAGLALRVRRLLHGETRTATPLRTGRGWLQWTACLGMISLAAWFGLLYGEPLLRLLPGVAR